jgi:hypothetical protein
MTAKRKPTRTKPPRGARARPAVQTHKGTVVKALEKAGLRISVRRGVKGDLDTIITNAVGRIVRASTGPAKPKELSKDGNKRKVARLVGSGIPKRDQPGAPAELPWASDDEIDQVIDLAKTLSSDEIAEKLHATRETINAWRKAGKLLGVEGAKRGVRYPLDQLGPNYAPLPLEDIIQALDSDHWAAWRFLAGPVHELGGRTGFELLRLGKLKELMSVLEGRACGAFS